MPTKIRSWKLQDAKAKFSELVRRAKTGEPQSVTVHGKEAVIVVDPGRFSITPKNAERGTKRGTMREFLEASKKYRGVLEGTDIGRSRSDAASRILASSCTIHGTAKRTK